MENEHSNKSATIVQDEEASSVEGILHAWQEHARLGRFFTKLIGEVVFVGADQVEFRLEGENVTGAISKDTKVFKTFSVKAHWMEPMHRWLVGRSSPVFRPDGADGLASSGMATSTVRIGETLVSFKVERSGSIGKIRSLTLSGFTIRGWGASLKLLSVLPHCKSSFEEIVNQPSGLIVLAVPRGCESNMAVATVLGCTSAVYVGDAGKPAVREAAATLSQDSLVLLTTAAEDPSDALVALRATTPELEAIRLHGILSMAFVPRVCSTCAKRSRVEPTVLAGFPLYFQKMSLEKYVVGRGCDACGHSGYQGLLALHSVLRITDAVARAYASGAGQPELVATLYPKGLRPLLEDGVRKALDGLTTFEAVGKAVKSAPQVYMELWKDWDESAAANAQAGGRTGQTARAGEGANDVESGPLFGRARPASRREHPTVLVVEDDPDQRAILEMVLKGAEYEVDQAANGEEALAKVRAAAPDLILCDLMMPKMDGSELVACLKRDAKYSRIPILMLTMVADEEKEYALLDLGADDYCDKTIQRKTLLKRIENLLRRAS